MGDQLLWAVKNGDLAAVKVVVDKVILWPEIAVPLESYES